MVEGKRFLSAADVAEIMECSVSQSYSIIRKLNAELSANGYIVLHGRINAKYFYERIYNGEDRTNGSMESNKRI